MFFKTLILTIAQLSLILSCQLINNSSTTNTQATQKEIFLSANHNVFEGGVPWVWFSPSSGEIFPFGEDSVSVNPDTSLYYFRVSPTAPEFLSVTLQNQLHYGVLYLGKGNEHYVADYLGDSLEFHYNLFAFGDPQKDMVYYLRSPGGAGQIQILDWNDVSQSLSFKWRAVALGPKTESVFTLEIPELRDSSSFYWMRLLDGDVVHSPNEDREKPEGYSFYLDPQLPLFKISAEVEGVGGIAFLGIGESYFNQNRENLNLANLNYAAAIATSHFKVGAVFILWDGEHYSQIMILNWDKAKHILRLRFKKLS